MTSIEWLFEQIEGEGDIQRDVLSNVLEIKISVSNFLEIKREAKEMHKAEIIKANRDGVDMAVDRKPFIMGEQYYQETFVSKRSDAKSDFDKPFIDFAKQYVEQLKNKKDKL
jgi:hypothetical protein